MLDNAISAFSNRIEYIGPVDAYRLVRMCGMIIGPTGYNLICVGSGKRNDDDTTMITLLSAGLGRNSLLLSYMSLYVNRSDTEIIADRCGFREALVKTAAGSTEFLPCHFVRLEIYDIPQAYRKLK